MVIYVIAHLFDKFSDEVSTYRLMLTTMNFHVSGAPIPGKRTQPVKGDTMQLLDKRWPQPKWPFRLQYSLIYQGFGCVKLAKRVSCFAFGLLYRVRD